MEVGLGFSVLTCRRDLVLGGDKNCGSNSAENSSQPHSLRKQLEYDFCYSFNPTLRIPLLYGKFALSLGKESAYIFSKFNLLNTNTTLKRTLPMATSLSMGFDCV